MHNDGYLGILRLKRRVEAVEALCVGHCTPYFRSHARQSSPSRPRFDPFCEIYAQSVHALVYSRSLSRIVREALSTSESEDSGSLGLPRDGGYNLLALDPTSLALPCLISDCPFRLGGWGPSGSSQVGRVTTVAIKIRAFLGKRKAPFGRRKTTNCPLKVASACRSRPLRSPVSVVGSASCKSLSVDRKDPPLHRPSSQPGHQDAKCL